MRAREPGIAGVNAARALWASVESDPVFMRRFAGWQTFFWLAMVPISILTGWVDSVRFVSVLSIIALALGSWSTYQAARVEVRQEEIARDAAPTPDPSQATP